MFRPALLTVLFTYAISSTASGQNPAPEWHMVYTPSHRATYEKEWKYTFPDHRSMHWIIALRTPPQLAWSKDVVGKAELLTSAGWRA
jgi:hypothetical protein